MTTYVIMRRHNGSMLRVAPWLLRVAGLVVVGLLTFLAPPSERGGTATQVVAYAAVWVGVMLWALAEFPRDDWHADARRAALPVALGVVTIAGCVGAAAGNGGNSLIGFAAVAVMTAADTLPLQACLAVAALGVLATEIGGIVFGQGVGPMLGFPLLLAVGVLFGRNRASLRVQAEQARQLLAQHELLQAEHRRADVLDERARIAREIHDVLAHSLGALGIQLQTVKALLTVHEDTQRALDALAAAQRMAAEGLTETRRAVHALRTDTLPLHDELARTGAEYAQRHHVEIRCRTSGTPVPLPPEATVALLRTAQESLVNAVKHAPGAAIEVDLDYRADGVRLTVTNPLTVAEPPASADAPGRAGNGAPDPLSTLDSGYGLTGMRERLLLLRGSLRAEHRDGQWVVSADLPISSSPLPQEASQ